MTTHATGTFDIDRWEQRTYDERDGARLDRASVDKTFHGDLEGGSTAQLLLAGSTAVETSRAYVAIERIEGRLHGRTGSFVLHHTAIGSAEGGSAEWTIVPDTGSGELRGLRGRMAIAIDPDGTHRYTLDYELSERPAATAQA
jgi:hypothetical protein